MRGAIVLWSHGRAKALLPLRRMRCARKRRRHDVHNPGTPGNSILESNNPEIGSDEMVSHANQVGQRVGLQLSHGAGAVNLHGFFSRANRNSNLFVQQSGRDQGGHLGFARCQP